MACPLDASGLGPVTVSEAAGCRVELPTAAADGGRTLAFQLIQTDNNCGAAVPATDASMLTYLTFYDAAGQALGSAAYPTVINASGDASGSTSSGAPRWIDAAGNAGAKANFSGSASDWATRELAYWTWSPAAAGSCDVVTSTMSAQGVLYIAADGTLSMSPGGSAPATAVLGTGNPATLVYGDTAGVLTNAASVGFGGYAGSPEYALTFAAPGADYPPPAAIPPPYFGVGFFATLLLVIVLVVAALWVNVRRGRREGARELREVVAQAKAAGATTITIN